MMLDNAGRACDAVSRSQEDRISKPHLVNRRWLPLNALRAFDAVGQRMSFTAGAQSLNVSQSAVSRHVISLEEMIGRKLFDRSGSRLVLTSAGQILLPEVAKAFDRIEAAINDLSGHAPRTRPIRIHIPPSFLHQIALPMIHAFNAEHPDIRIDISSSHVTGMPLTETDMAIVFDLPGVDDRVTDLLGLVRVAPVCAPATAARHEGKPLADFLADNLLLHVKLENEPRGLLWGRFARQCRIDLDVDRGLAFDTALLAVMYAMTADGVALADVDMFEREMANGRLIMPYNSVVADGFGYYLKLRAEDLSDPAISLVRSWLIAGFAARRTVPDVDSVSACPSSGYLGHLPA
jgi:LysR family glycine cleavage system transcriptional activator